MDDRPIIIWLAAAVAMIAAGCGTTKMQEATEQLVLSSAVDRSVSMIDFRPLAGQSVFLDTTYLKNPHPPAPNLPFPVVNTNYVTSAMRQQIMAAGCFLQESADLADIVIEARMGTLGADDHRVTYGIPENNGLATAASFVVRTATPSVPEIALARRDAREGAAKIAAFAYDRETRMPIWQSGVSQSIATSRNTWVLGVGPFQGGSIREGTHLVKGTNRSGRTRPGASPSQAYDRPIVEHTAEVRYDEGWPMTGKSSPNSSSSGTMIGSGLPKRPPELNSADQPLESAPTDVLNSEPAANMAEQPAMIEDETLLR